MVISFIHKQMKEKLSTPFSTLKAILVNFL